jgi:dTDP-4-dehydrorhamnose 3,5-epimerase
MEFVATNLQACYELRPKVQADARGHFVKVFQSSQFALRGLQTNFEEDYYSFSSRNVLRGMHFQSPPFEHEKLVYCVLGEVLDVALDLRRDSVTFGKTYAVNLSAEKANAVYLPKGIAHGFLVLSERACMVYKVGSEYSPTHDQGIHWQSVPFVWPTSTPIVSARDAAFIDFPNFSSPF